MKRLNMTRCIHLLFSITGVCVYSKTIRSTSSNNNSDNNVSTSNQGRTLTLPILTYHTLKQRRMLEIDLDEDGMELYLKNLHTDQYNESTRRMSSEVEGMYQGYGTHYVDLWVGTPPQRQTVIVDTGSTVTAFPCSSCEDCGENFHASKYFIEANSVSFQKTKCDFCTPSSSCHTDENNEYCQFGVSYTEGSSWTAYESEDLAYIGGPHDHALDAQPFLAMHRDASVADEDPADAAKFRFPMQFGCQTQVTGLFKTQLADGIMGMSSDDGSFWYQMYNQDMIDHRRFSLCFRERSTKERSGTPAGAITMGGTDTNLHKSPMAFAKGYLSSKIYNGVVIREAYFMRTDQHDTKEATQSNSIRLNTPMDELNGNEVILDSGTTATYLHRSIQAAFKNTFKSIVGVDLEYYGGMTLTDDQVKLLPNFVIQLEGVDTPGQSFDHSNPHATPGLAGKLDPDHPNDVLVVITPDHYMKYDRAAKKYRPLIYVTGFSRSVLGANFMAGHDIMFDILDNRRIGIAPSDCNYVNLTEGSHHNSNSITDVTTR